MQSILNEIYNLVQIESGDNLFNLIVLDLGGQDIVLRGGFQFVDLRANVLDQ